MRFENEAQFNQWLEARKVRQQTPVEIAPVPKVVEPRRGRMNKTEARYAQEVLDVQKHTGEITGYWFEGMKLRLADNAWYCPDFTLLFPDGHIEYIEIKGHWRTAARLRIKIAADRYPFRFTAVRRIKGEWVTEEF